jgi:putative Holliday junction resolvase
VIILSVDYGDKRTGIACCDRDEILASPVTVIEDDYARRVAQKVAEIAAEKKAQRIVVGLPKNMDGTLGFRAEACTEFARLVGEVSGIETVMYDERLTTVIAHKELNFTDTRGKKRKKVVDALSAVVILEDYIKNKNN